LIVDGPRDKVMAALNAGQVSVRMRRFHPHKE